MIIKGAIYMKLIKKLFITSNLLYIVLFIVSFCNIHYSQDIQVSETGDAEFDPVIASDSVGNFVLVWSDYRNEIITLDPNKYGGDIYGQRMDKDGNKIGSNFRVSEAYFANDTLNVGVSFPDLSMNKVGRFVVCYQMFRRDDSIIDVYYHLYDEFGNSVDSSRIVNEKRVGAQFDPKVIMWDDGSFIIFWQTGSSENWRIYYQRFDNIGAKIDSNQFTDQYGPNYKIAKYSHNRFMIVVGTQGIIYDNQGNQVSESIKFSRPDSMDLNLLDVAVSFDSRIFLALNGSSLNQGGNIPEMNVFVQSFDTLGNPISEFIRVNDDTTFFRQSGPTISVADSFVFMAWQDHRDGYSISGCHNIYAQRFDLGLNGIGANFKLTHENNESVQRSVRALLIKDMIYSAWMDGRKKEFYPGRYPPMLKKDVWCTIQNFMNPVPGTIIKCNPPAPEPPEYFILLQNYPNPFNNSTTFYYELPVDGIVELILYNTLGQKVKTLFKQYETANRYKKTFNNFNISSGVYFALFYFKTTDGIIINKVQKIVLIK